MFTFIANNSPTRVLRYFSKPSTSAYTKYITSSTARWFGKLVPDMIPQERRDKVCSADFMSLLENKNPKLHMQKLTPRNRKNRRASYSMCCSAPKSVSIVNFVQESCGESCITKAHESAMESALNFMESKAQFRLHIDNKRKTKDSVSDGICAMLVTHRYSRERDMQLHTHVEIMNATKHGGKMYAIQTGEIAKNLPVATAIYRNELAMNLMELGYKISWENGVPEIEGVTIGTNLKYSKGAERIAVAAGFITNKEVGPKLKAKLAASNKRRKMTESEEVANAERLKKELLSNGKLDLLRNLNKQGALSMFAEFVIGMGKNEETATADKILDDTEKELNMQNEAEIMYEDYLLHVVQKSRGRIRFAQLQKAIVKRKEAGKLILTNGKIRAEKKPIFVPQADAIKTQRSRLGMRSFIPEASPCTVIMHSDIRSVQDMIKDELKENKMKCCVLVPYKEAERGLKEVGIKTEYLRKISDCPAGCVVFVNKAERIGQGKLSELILTAKNCNLKLFLIADRREKNLSVLNKLIESVGLPLVKLTEHEEELPPSPKKATVISKKTDFMAREIRNDTPNIKRDDGFGFDR